MSLRTFSWRMRTATGARAARGGHEHAAAFPLTRSAGQGFGFSEQSACVGRNKRVAATLREGERVASGCDVRGAAWRIGKRHRGLRQHDGAVMGAGEASRRAGDGRGGIVCNALQRLETRGEIGSGNDAAPFVVTAAPVIQAGVEAV